MVSSIPIPTIINLLLYVTNIEFIIKYFIRPDMSINPKRSKCTTNFFCINYVFSSKTYFVIGVVMNTFINIFIIIIFTLKWILTFLKHPLSDGLTSLVNLVSLSLGFPLFYFHFEPEFASRICNGISGFMNIF